MNNHKEAKARFGAIRVGASLQFPFLSEALYALIPVCSPGLGTWAVDKYGRVYYDPEVILKETTKEGIATLVHEVWHVLRNHIPRAEVIPNCNGELANIAQDLEINESCEFLRKNLPDGGVTHAWIHQRFGKTLPPNRLFEEYYRLLSEDGQSPGRRRGREPGDNPRDTQAKKDAPKPKENEEQLSEDDLNDIRKEAARQIQETSRTRGDIPGSWVAWAQVELEPPAIPWRSVLQRFLRRAHKKKAGGADFTYARRSRRQSAISNNPRFQGVVLPASFRPILDVAVVIDTSGSMSDRDLNRALSEVDGVLRAVGARVHVVCADTRITSAKKISKVSQIELKGRGGTDLREAIKVAAKGEGRDGPPCAVLVMTDGYTPWPRKLRVPMIACLMGHNCGAGNIPAWATALVVED